MSQQNDIVEFRLSGGGGNTLKSNSVGDWISEQTGGIIQSNTINNLFDDVSRSNMIAGMSRYKAIYARIKKNSEGLPSAKFWLDKDTQTDENYFEWALETDYPYANGNRYRYEPCRFYDGNDRDTYGDVADLVQFSCSAWVRYGATFSTTGVIVIKENYNNQNFGIWIDANQKINGGFNEVTTLTAHYATSPLAYNDWNWHHIVVTYDQVTVKLYIDGNTTPVATHSTTTTPNTGTNNLAIGGNASVNDRYFDGEIDEVFVWSNDLTTSEIAALYSDGTIPQLSNLQFREQFGVSQHLYRHMPFKAFYGAEYTEQAHASNLNLVQFSFAFWFRSYYNATDDEPLITKGKFGSAVTTESHNYMAHIRGSDKKLLAGFEEQSGTTHYATSPNAVNDSDWHLCVCTYDQVTVRLFLDGHQVATHSTTTTPATNTLPFRIGRDSADVYLNDTYMDEIYLWNNDLTGNEIIQMFYNDVIPQEGAIVYEQHYGADNGGRIARKQVNDWFAPDGLTWNGQSSPPADPNFYARDLERYYGEAWTSSIYPIWIKQKILPNSNDSIDNKGFFKLSGILRRENTPQGEHTDIPSNADNVKIGFVSDTDCNSVTDDVLDVMKSKGVQKWLIAGDMTYNGTSCWFDRVQKRFSLSNVIPAIGNHDEDSGKRSTWISKFNMGRGWYYRVVENIGIICMDSESSFSSSSDQYDDILAWLKKLSADSNIDWIIVMIHRPFFGSDSNHDVNEGGKADTYLPLFTQYKVDFVLQAHNHNTQITHLLKDNTSNHESPKIVDSSSPYAKHTGFVGITSGAGGHNGRDASDGDLYSINSHPSYNAYENDDDNGFVMLSFEGTNNTTCKIQWWNINGEKDFESIVS